MKILQNWLKISWFSLTVKFVCEGPVANFTLPLLKVYDKELLWIEATWITLHGESVLLCFPYVTEQWNLRGGGGGGGIIIEQLSSLSFSFPLPPLCWASVISLQPSAGLGAQWCQFSTYNLGRGRGGRRRRKGVEHRQADASMSIPWALWFGGWMRGRVLLFWNRKAHFQKFQHTAKNLSVWSWNNVQLYPFENTETWNGPGCQRAAACQLSWESWAVGSRQHCWWYGWGESVCAAPQFIRSISNKLQVWVVNSKLILPRHFSYCLLLLGLCLWSHLDGLAGLSPRVLKWQIFCLVVLSFQMWSLWS